MIKTIKSAFFMLLRALTLDWNFSRILYEFKKGCGWIKTNFTILFIFYFIYEKHSFEIGQKFKRTDKSKLDFSNGCTTACLKLSGTPAELILLLKSLKGQTQHN